MSPAPASLPMMADSNGGTFRTEKPSAEIFREIMHPKSVTTELLRRASHWGRFSNGISAACSDVLRVVLRTHPRSGAAPTLRVGIDVAAGKCPNKAMITPPANQNETSASGMTRRTFVKATAAFAGVSAFSAGRVLGANERIGV